MSPPPPQNENTLGKIIVVLTTQVLGTLYGLYDSLTKMKEAQNDEFHTTRISVV